MTWIMKDPEVVETVLEDGAVLLNLRTKFYYSLNGVGYKIWQLLDSAESSEELFQKAMAAYEAESGKIKEGISKFLGELEQEQLVIPEIEGTDKHSTQGPHVVYMDSVEKKPFVEPELIKHDEPLHEVVQNPFDPQLPLAE